MLDFQSAVLNPPTFSRWLFSTRSKAYKGTITALPPPLDARTISILNYRENIKIDQDNIILKDFVGLDNVIVTNRNTPLYEYNRLTIKKSDIIMAYDIFDKMGKDADRIRHLKAKVNRFQRVDIITETVGYNTCYRITGEVANLFTKLENNYFIPVKKAVLEKIITFPNSSLSEETEETYGIKTFPPVEFPFLAVNKDYIQAFSH